MKHLNKYNESTDQIFNHLISGLSEDEKREFCIDHGVCPECGSKLVRRDDGEGGEYAYRICPTNKYHYSKYLGYAEDLDE